MAFSVLLIAGVAILGLALFVGLVFIIAIARQNREVADNTVAAQPTPANQPVAPNDRYREVWELLQRGQKIEAIQIYRAENPNASLKEAKQAVEAIGLGQTPRKVEAVAPPLGWQNQVAEALREGNKIQAIKIYREATGVGLKEAKDAVEALERR